MEPSMVNAEFSTCGLTLGGEAMREVLIFLGRQNDPDTALQSLLATLQAAALSSAVLTAPAVQAAVASLYAGVAPGATASPDEGPAQLVDAFAMPRIEFDSVQRCFHSLPTPPKLLAAPASRVGLARERFHLVAQRLARSALFAPPALAGGAAACQLTPLQALLGSAGSTRFVLGTLSSLADGRFWLEDPSGAVAVDLSRAATAAGLFTEGCCVLAEGALRKDGVFEVVALGFPPAEERAASVTALNGLQLHGAPMAPPPGVVPAAGEDEEEMWVVLSDVYLDAPHTAAALDRVLQAFEAMPQPPALFLLCGDFCAAHAAGLAAQKAAFEVLGAMLRACPNLRAHSHFVLLPGPGDAGPSPCLPRPPLPRSLVRPLLATLPAATLASNPLRLLWRSHQTVLFREDLAAKMRAACVRPPADDGVDASEVPGAALFAHLAATLLQQSHLAPLPLSTAPVHWEWDHALYLLPPPHCLILADRSVPQASTRFEDTVCFNPGSFGADGSFAVYRPASRVVELSCAGP